MTATEMRAGPAIGATLRGTRSRRKIDITEVEEADQDPGPLPAGDRERGVGGPAGPAVREGLPPHLRRSILGLDGERLADDYRRSDRGARAAASAAAREPVLSKRRRSPATRPSLPGAA